MIIIMPDAEDRDAPVAEEYRPDLIIHKLSDLLTCFQNGGRLKPLQPS